MKTLYHWSVLIFMVLVLSSCDDDALEQALGNYEERLVIDGFIEQGKFPVVALTLSSAYLEDVRREDLIRSSVLNAKVTVSCEGNTEVLTLRPNNNGFPESIYRGSDIRGELGKTYALEIIYNNQTYTATTTIPLQDELDSLWFSKDETAENKFFLKGRVTDDPNGKDFYRIFTQRIGKDNKFIPMYLSTLADTFIEGKTLDFTIFRGIQNISETREDGFFEKGDSVAVRFTKIDESHFDFWSTAEREIYSFSNPFSSSGNDVIFNVSNNAIGIWGGYAATYYYLKAD